MIISASVGDSQRALMKAHPEINWSRVFRDAIDAMRPTLEKKMKPEDLQAWVNHMGGTKAAADELGVEPSTIYRWVMGKRAIPLLVWRYIDLQASTGHFGSNGGDRD